MRITVNEFVATASVLVFYGSAATIAVSWIAKNRRNIRFSQWLGIIAALAFWPISLAMVVLATVMDMSLEMND